MSTSEAPELVVAIDIGTAYSGYAFSFKDDYDKNPATISGPQCFIAGSSSLVSQKTSSSLLLDKNKKIISFGFDAESKYAECADKKEVYFFHRFKMSLYHSKDISSKMKILDITKKKTMLALDVFSLSILALRNHFHDLLKERNLKRPMEEHILWVITVPAIWPPSSKVFMTECALKAGIKETQIQIALEPESGAIFCQQMVDVRFTEVGSTYLVADLGGGTADLTVHEKLQDGKLKELHKADGVDAGGTNVDKKFLEFYSELLETPNIESFLCEESLLDIYRSIEITKRRLKYNEDNEFHIDIPNLITLSGKRDLTENITMLVENYCMKHGKGIMRKVLRNPKSNKVAVQASHLKILFNETVDEIIKKIRNVLSECNTSNNVGTILLIGGFSESTVVSGRIKAAFQSETVIVPTEASTAIIKGAVLEGHNNGIILSRILTHSYGHQICSEFDVTKDEGRETLQKDGKTYCVDSFKEIVAAGMEIKCGDVKQIVVNTIFDFQPAVQIQFYACPDRTPDHVDDPDCTEIGGVFVPLLPPLPAGRPILINVQFGGAVIRVTAMDGIKPIPCRVMLDLKK